MASEPSIGNAHSEASINQLISTPIIPINQPSMYLNVGNMIPTQPLVISDQSRVKILMRDREARRRRRRRRAQRRREDRTEHQQFQQQEYYRNHWYNERERQERQDQDHNEDVHCQSLTINEPFD